MLRAAWLILCCPLAPSPTTAAEIAEGVAEEIRFLREETVTTPLRQAVSISQSPSNVYILTDEDIRHSGATDLPTVLRRIPGMEVMQMNGADYNVSARGDNQVFANKMLVLVDGRSIYVDVQGSVFWKTIPVTLPEIKRIEVVKGPIESLYGFNAFDGVINIITKSPEEMKGTTLQFGGGELGTISSAAVHAGKQGNLGYRLSVGEDQNQQWKNRDALAFRTYKLNAHTEYALPADARLSLSGGIVDANRFQGPVTDRAVLNGKFTDSYVNTMYERGNFLIRAWWRQFDTSADFFTHPGLAPFVTIRDKYGNPSASFTNNTYNVEAQHALEFGSSNRLTYGVNYRHNSLSSSIINAFSREDRLGFYVQDEWRATERLTFVGGLRYDLHTEITPTVSPRAAVLYRVAEDHTLRASVSVAYRPPTLLESHLDTRPTVTTPLGTLTTQGLANPNLQPEQIISYEAGYQGWYFKHRLRLRADLFFNHITDLISVSNPTATTAFNTNGGEGDIYGGEVGAEFSLASWLTGFANYSYQEIGQNFSARSQRGAPRFKYNLGLRGEWTNGLNSEVTFHHYGSAVYGLDPTFTTLAPFGAVRPDPRVGSYNLLNLRIGYLFWRDKAEVAFAAYNALNDKHLEHPLGEVIGSRVMGWLTLRL
ncbi:MAG TPA: TonB-dependent receptor [Nitrospiraceae bacterium]|nr:TonB-dependent receptor [Nitrospiraceae bacterium]